MAVPRLGPPQLGAGLPGRGRVLDRAHQGHAEELGAHRLQERVPPDGGGRRRQRQGGQPLRRRAQDVAGGGAQHQAGQQRRVPPVQQLGDHAAHRVAHGDEPADAEDLRQRGDVVGAVLEPEPPAGADAVAVAAQVDGDHAEVPGERGEDRAPVEFGREGDPVDEHERRCAAGARALPHPRDTAAGQLHQARTRSRGLPGYLPHGSLSCDASRRAPATAPSRRSTTASGPCVPDARSATGTEGPDTLWFYPCWW